MATRTRVLGTTRILEPIGEGGMAQVFLGEQRTLNRKVAVKVMRPDFLTRSDFVKRFRREALAMASLEHENIVTVYDFVEKNEQLFLVMEYVEGVDVQQLLKNGPLPLDVALIAADGVVRALEHAHFHRVIHRDVKPSNVMLSARGQVKLMDFGIAKDLQGPDLTKTGVMVGTPAYQAPEVLGGGRADQQSDLYALGVVLFRCIAGRGPFGRRRGTDLQAAILAGDHDRLRDVVPSCPRGVEKMIHRCLEVDPARRFRNAAELRSELAKHLGRELASTPAARVVTFLYQYGHAGPEHLSTLALDELRLADGSLDLSVVVEAPEPDDVDAATGGAPSPSDAPSSGEASGRSGPGVARVLLVGLLLVALAGAALYVLAPDVVAEALERLTGRPIHLPR